VRFGEGEDDFTNDFALGCWQLQNASNISLQMAHAVIGNPPFLVAVRSKPVMQQWPMPSRWP
jgi:hypothetical protein